MSENSKINQFNSKLIDLLQKGVEFFKANYLNKLKTNKTEKINLNLPGDIGTVHIYSHLDTDGICAAVIMAKALMKENIGFQITILKQLDDQYFIDIEYTAKVLKHFIIFTDFGSGQLNIIQKYLEGIPHIILDHHEPLKEGLDNTFSKEKLNYIGFHANCFLAGVNGSNEISGAGMAYLFVKLLNSSNIELAYLAIIGAIGDLQNSWQQQTFLGENLKILKDAIQINSIKVESEPNISRSKSLAYAIAYTLPFQIEGLKQDIQSVYKFLDSIGISHKNDFGEERTLADLSLPEKTKLINNLVRKILESPESNITQINEIIAKTYLIEDFKEYKEIYDGKDLSKMINACGRLEKHSIIISALVTNNPKYIDECIKIMHFYSDQLKNSINWLENNKKLIELNNLYYFYGENVISENIIGVVCSNLIFDSSINSLKPIIGYADADENNYKISARCSSELIRKGVNLSEAIRNVSAILKLELKGGGHAPASGAKIPKNLIKSFIDLLDKEIEKQKK